MFCGHGSGLTEFKEINSSLVASDVEVVVEKPTGLESQLCEIVTPIITKKDATTRFENLL